MDYAKKHLEFEPSSCERSSTTIDRYDWLQMPFPVCELIRQPSMDVKTQESDYRYSIGQGYGGYAADSHYY